MKFKSVYSFLILFLFFSSCEVKWDMEITFNEDLSGSYNIAVLIDQEAQLYATDTGQSSIGGLDAILANLPEGFGSSIYQEGDFLGILIRNNFNDVSELESQFALLESEENSALLLLPIEDIDFLIDERHLTVSGKFAEIFVTDDENLEGFKRIFDGQLSIKVPGEILEPQLNEIVNNTIIFENDGLSVKTFELVTRTKPLISQQNLIIILFLVLSVVYFFVRQKNKKK